MRRDRQNISSAESAGYAGGLAPGGKSQTTPAVAPPPPFRWRPRRSPWALGCALLTLLCSGGAMAQESPNFKLSPSVVSAGGDPANGAAPSSPAFGMRADCAGEAASSGTMSSSRFRLDSGFLPGLPAAAPATPGDCDGSGEVSIGEVQRAITMFLGVLPPSCGADCNGDGSVSIGELQRVINAFLGLSSSC